MRRLLDDEDGRRRPHVRVFYNEIAEDDIEDRNRPATDRDEIMIIQSVSGGAMGAPQHSPGEARR